MKFINLLKKELSELINTQLLISLAFVLGIFIIMGSVMKSATSEIVSDTQNPQINLCDMDDTEFTREMIASFKAKGTKIKSISVSGEDYASAFSSDSKLKSFIIIPHGFTDEINSGKKPEVLSVGKIKSVSAFSSLTGGTEGTVSLINGYVSLKLAEQQGVSNDDLGIIEAPIKVTEHTVVADKSAEISGSSIMGKLIVQNMVLPIIVLVLIMMTSQSLIASISNEKIDKTLETLLSTPVSRGSVITAKMLAAAITALINAGVMMIGFTFYTKEMFGSVTTNVTSSLPAGAADSAKEAVSSIVSSGEAMSKLGLTLSTGEYLLVGVQLFLTIMICLAMSIILGALVNDSKSAQNMLLPIVMMVMIPWLVTLFTDINSLPLAAKVVMWAIPFTHTFTAMPNLMFGNYTAFWGGFAYQIAFFAVVMFFALKLFKSDKILTISLNFGQKSKFRKSGKTNED